VKLIKSKLELAFFSYRSQLSMDGASAGVTRCRNWPPDRDQDQPEFPLGTRRERPLLIRSGKVRFGELRSGE
jgi:hypothetical protein